MFAWLFGKECKSSIPPGTKVTSGFGTWIQCRLTRRHRGPHKWLSVEWSDAMERADRKDLVACPRGQKYPRTAVHYEVRGNWVTCATYHPDDQESDGKRWNAVADGLLMDHHGHLHIAAG